jgi:hypothetical protein
MLVYDLRLAVRRLLHEPGFTLAAVLTLALGVGANVAVHRGGVLLRPPYPDADRWSRSTTATSNRSHRSTSGWATIDIARQQQSFSDRCLRTGQGRFMRRVTYQVSRYYRRRARGPTRPSSEDPHADDSRSGPAGDAKLRLAVAYRIRSLVGRTIRVDQEDRRGGIAPPAFRFLPNYGTDIVASFTLLPRHRPSG